MHRVTCAHDRARVPFAEAAVFWSAGRAELLDDRRGRAVVTVVVSDELATAIDTQVLNAKSERHDEVLHELDQSRQRFVLRREDVYGLELDVVVRALGHEAVVPAHRGRHGTQDVGADELKPPHDLGLARLVANWLFGAVVFFCKCRKRSATR